MHDDGPDAALRPGATPTEPLDLIAAALHGIAPAYPRDPPPRFLEHILEISAVHGLEALLDAALYTSAESTSWPLELRERLRSITRAKAARELLINRELDRLLPALAEAGIHFLLLKGTPLAYAVYPQPYLRSRGDTDLLVPPTERGLAEEVLLGAGYRSGESAGGALASYERTYTKTDTAGVEHVLDLHWQLSNLQIYARAFSFEELETASVPVPALGPHARMPNPVYGLLIACLHRVTHLHAPYYVDDVPYLEANRLIWLYDIHLLANRLSMDDWDGLVALASAKGFRAICLDGLTETRRTLHTDIPESVLSRLAAPGAAELSAGYLKVGPRGYALLELRALQGWGERLRLVRDWFFPPAAYILSKYGVQGRWRLPWLYLRRALGGILRRML